MTTRNAPAEDAARRHIVRRQFPRSFPQPGDVKDARATSDLTLTTSFVDVPGATITLPEPGIWEIKAVFDISVTVAGVGNCIGQLVGQTTESEQAIFTPASTGRSTVSQVWRHVVITPGTVVKLQAKKDVATGTATALATHTTITASRGMGGSSGGGGGGGGGGSALTVQEEDGAPIDTAVTIIRVPNGALVDNGVGDVSLNLNGYALLAGRAGGQTLIGGTAASENLTLQSTSHATRGVILANDDVRLASGAAIQDSGGTDRIALATSSPQVTLTGDVKISANLAVNNMTPDANLLIIARVSAGGADGKVAIVADMGGITGAPGTSSIIGVAGRALARDAATLIALGLDYIAGVGSGAAATTNEASCIRGQLLNASSGKTITDGYTFHARNPTVVGGLITNVYGYYSGITATTANRFPFYDLGISSTVDTIGNRFRSNTQFGSVTGAFGTGNGVIGIANATTNPSTNPTGGGVLYSNAGAGTWRGSGGTVTAFGPAGPHCGKCGADFWRVCASNEKWGAQIRECGWCGQVYKKGPKSFLNLLTPEQKAELIYA